MKFLRASRVVPYTPNKAGERVLVKRAKKNPSSKILSPARNGPFIVKAEDHPRYTLRTYDRRRFRLQVTPED